jgi:MFS family permease
MTGGRTDGKHGGPLGRAVRAARDSLAVLPPGIRMVALSAGAINLGTFAVAPFLAVLMARLGFSAAQIGLVLAANLATARLLPLAAGVVGDRTKHSHLMIAGLAVRGCGFAAFALDDSFWWYALSSALVGLGGALYEPSANAVVANQDEEIRRRGYSVLNLAQNAGALGGPLVGGVLVAVDPTALFLTSAAVMGLLTVRMFWGRHSLITPSTDSTVATSLSRVFTNRPFVRFGLAMGLFWLIDAQFATALPEYAVHLTGKIELAGSVLIVNGCAGMLALLAVAPQFEKRRALPLAAAGFGVVAVTIGAVSILPSLVWLLGCVAVYTLGETLIFVSADIYIAEVADNRDAGAFFGGHDVFWAVGGTAGFFAGSSVAGVGTRSIWLVFTLAALAGLALLAPDLRRVPTVEPAAGTPVEGLPAGPAGAAVWTGVEGELAGSRPGTGVPS